MLRDGRLEEEPLLRVLHRDRASAGSLKRHWHFGPLPSPASTRVAHADFDVACLLRMNARNTRLSPALVLELAQPKGQFHVDEQPRGCRHPCLRPVLQAAPSAIKGFQQLCPCGLAALSRLPSARSIFLHRESWHRQSRARRRRCSSRAGTRWGDSAMSMCLTPARSADPR